MVHQKYQKYSFPGIHFLKSMAKKIKTSVCRPTTGPVCRILLSPVVRVHIARSKSQRERQETDRGSTGARVCHA